MPSSARFSILKRTLGVLALGFVAIQFIRPSLNNRPATAEIQVPDDVKQILMRSCYDCHSNESKLAWFDLPSPINWLVIHDIREARTHINFSEIGKLPTSQQRAALYEGLFQVQQGAMPLPAYRRLHPGAAISEKQISVLKRFLAQPKEALPTNAIEATAADSEFQKWVTLGNDLAANVQTEPNGLSFLFDYKNWIPISSTDRFDNQTIRQIFGNEIALKAIANHQCNPWPDGTAFAKVAWKQQVEANGVIRPGAFYQVEFMFRDSKNRSSTLGWAWSRWRGADLKPYGKDAHFDQECVGCHRPLKKSDYVFSVPIPPSAADDPRSLSGNLPANPLAWRIITSEIDRTSGTMSTLYGNDDAVIYARTHTQSNYPAGSVLAFVTWTQKPDERWFGANIPSAAKSIEFVTVKSTGGIPAFVYERYEGLPLKKVSSQEGATSNERIGYLLSRRAAVLP
jgi:hypothetical protein